MAIQPTDFCTKEGVTDFVSLQKALATGLGQTAGWGTRQVFFADGSVYSLKEVRQAIHSIYEKNVHFNAQEREAAERVIIHVVRLYRQADESLKQYGLMKRVLIFILDWFRYTSGNWAREKKVWDEVTIFYTDKQREGTDLIHISGAPFLKFKKEMLYAVQPSTRPRDAVDLTRYVGDDLVLQVFKLLDTKTLARARGVNREWNILALDCSLYHSEDPIEPCIHPCARRAERVAEAKIGYNLRRGNCDQHHYRVFLGREDAPHSDYHPTFLVIDNKLIVALLGCFEVFDLTTHTSIKRINAIPGNAFHPPLAEERGFSGNTLAFTAFHSEGKFSVNDGNIYGLWEIKTLTCLYAVRDLPPAAVSIALDDKLKTTAIVSLPTPNRLVWTNTANRDQSLTIEAPQEDLRFNVDPFGIHPPDGPHEITPKWCLAFHGKAIYCSPKRIACYHGENSLLNYAIDLPFNTYLVGFEKMNEEILACQVKVVDENGERNSLTDRLQLISVNTGAILHDYPSFWMYGHATADILPRPLAMLWSFHRYAVPRARNLNILVVLSAWRGTEFHTIDVKTGTILWTFTTRALANNERDLQYFLVHERLVVQTYNYSREGCKTSLAIYDPYTGKNLINYPNLGSYSMEHDQQDKQMIVLKNWNGTYLFLDSRTGEMIGTYQTPPLSRFATLYDGRAASVWKNGKAIFNSLLMRNKTHIEFDLANFAVV